VAGPAQPHTLVLASASPQRRAMLERLGVAFELRPTHVEEIERGEPEQVAVQNALRKARAARAPLLAGEVARPLGEASEIVLGCDTLLALDGRIYGKPADEGEARATLRALSGATHTVLSGLALLSAEDERVALARTEVDFRELGEDSIDWYVASGEWRGRAGGYAIQGMGAALVRAIRGDYENVVGLPLATLLDIYPSLLSEHTRDRR
jgi:septum formation protein